MLVVCLLHQGWCYTFLNFSLTGYFQYAVAALSHTTAKKKLETHFYQFSASCLHDSLVANSQVMRDIINARMLEIVSAASMAIEDNTTTAKQHESQLSEGRDLDEPKLIIETRTEQPLEREQEEKKQRHGSRLSHRHYSDREPRSKEGSSGESKRKEKWRRDSRRSRSRERDKSRSRKKSRSRSTSRGRRSSGGHPDQSRERHRHKKKKSRDREREKRGSRTESESESRDKSSHS